MQVLPLNEFGDCVRLLRHLSEMRLEPHIWRRQRPHLLIEGATFEAETDADSATTTGRLHLDAYVRAVPLSANQLITLPGGGDFGIESICAAPELVPLDGMHAHPLAVSNSASSEGLVVLAAPDENRYVVCATVVAVTQIRRKLACMADVYPCVSVVNSKYTRSLVTMFHCSTELQCLWCWSFINCDHCFDESICPVTWEFLLGFGDK
jgi:hypothetical protein